MKHARLITICLGTLLLLAVLGGVSAHLTAKGRLASLKQSLAARGEPLDYRDIVPPAPTNAANGMPAVMAALNQLPNYESHLRTEGMRILSPGRAMVLHRVPVLPMSHGKPPVSNLWEELEIRIEPNRMVFEDLRTALTNEAFWFDLDYSKNFALLLPHLQKLRDGSRWLGAAAIHDLHRGDVPAAVACVENQFELLQCWVREPIVISDLVAIAMHLQTLESTWELMQHPDLSGEALTRLQALVANWQPAGQWEKAFLMERALAIAAVNSRELHTMMDFNPLKDAAGQAMEGVNRLFDRPGKSMEAFRNSAALLVWPVITRHYDEGWYIERISRDVKLLRDGLARRSAKDHRDARLAASPPEPAKAYRLASMIYFATENVAQKYFTAQTQRSLLLAALALERWRRVHGTYPESLAQLVPEFLAEVPVDYMDGQPLRYRRAGDEHVLYSIGADLTDDGGDPTPVSSRDERRWYGGRDWVWPFPASAEEVTTHLDDVRKEMTLPGSP